jgi:hypothetical protein
LLLSINSIGEKNGCGHYFAASQQKHRYTWTHLLLHSQAMPKLLDVACKLSPPPLNGGFKPLIHIRGFFSARLRRKSTAGPLQ